jgi:hypothetical protein
VTGLYRQAIPTGSNSSPSLRSGERPSGVFGLPIRITPQANSKNDQWSFEVRKRLSDTLRPLQAKRIRTVVRLTASDTSDQKNHSRGWDRQCGEPLTFCLSAQGNRQDRSDDHATLDGLKRFRLSRAWFSDRARFGRSLPGVRQVG